MVALVIAKTQWSVTPSLRVAAFSHRNKIGQPVLVDADLKTKLCKHGETSSTIRTWLQLEAQARAEGKDPPPRGTSKCDCTSTHGLQNRTDTGPVEPPTCVYDVLAYDDRAAEQPLGHGAVDRVGVEDEAAPRAAADGGHGELGAHHGVVVARVLVALDAPLQQLVRAARHQRRVAARLGPRVHVVQPDEELEPVARAVVVPQARDVLGLRGGGREAHRLVPG